MNQHNYNSNPKLKPLKIITPAMLVVVPIVYLIVANVMNRDSFAMAGEELLIYILIIVAIVLPALIPMIEKSQIKSTKNSTSEEMTLESFFTTISITKIAIVNACYIFGIVTFFLTGDRIAMLWFYPIGIFWSIIYWPTQSRYEKFIAKVQSNELE